MLFLRGYIILGPKYPLPTLSRRAWTNACGFGYIVYIGLHLQYRDYITNIFTIYV